MRAFVVGERALGLEGGKQQLLDRARHLAGSDKAERLADAAQAVCLAMRNLEGVKSVCCVADAMMSMRPSSLAMKRRRIAAMRSANGSSMSTVPIIQPAQVQERGHAARSILSSSDTGRTTLRSTSIALKIECDVTVVPGFD